MYFQRDPIRPPIGGHHYDFHTMACAVCKLEAQQVMDGQWRMCRDAGYWPREIAVPLRSIGASQGGEE